MLRRVFPAQVTAVAEDEVEVIVSTAALARDGHVLVSQGCLVENYRRNPIWLWSHNTDIPTGNAEDIVIGTDAIRCKVRFAPKGISLRADEANGLVKAGVVRAVSIGFDPIEMEPLDPKKPRGGQLITKWEWLEASWVAVPADPGAVVTARSKGEKSMSDWQVGAAKGLPIEDDDAWDGAAATESIFAWAGGDAFDPAKARQGFLVYDAADPKVRESYKLPIAHAVEGALKVPKGAIRAAASRLPQTDLPDEVKTAAGEVLDAYRQEAGIGDENRAGRRPLKTRRGNAVRRGAGLKLERGPYAVADLCWLFECLGWQVEMAKFEAAIEGDDSKVPAMLAAVFHDLGDALLAMTQEEIAEALAGSDVEPEADDDEDDAVLMVEARAHIAAAGSPRLRAFRRGLAHAKLRGGKTLSAETVRCLREAKALHEDAMDLHRSAMRKHKDGVAAVDDMMDRAGVSDETVETTQTVQTSDGTDLSGGSDNGRALSADFRRRQAEALGLAAVS